MLNGKLKGSLEYFFEDENFGGNLWNSHPYLVWENSKFETETSKLGGHTPSVLAVNLKSDFLKASVSNKPIFLRLILLKEEAHLYHYHDFKEFSFTFLTLSWKINLFRGKTF